MCLSHVKCLRWLILGFGLFAATAYAENHVLSLNDNGDYVQIVESEHFNAIDAQVTVEMWFRATAFPNQWIPFFYKGDRQRPKFDNRSFQLLLNRAGYFQVNGYSRGKPQISIYQPKDLIGLNRWYHLAGVIDAPRGEWRVYLNGLEAASGVFPSPRLQPSSLPPRIGSSYENWLGLSTFVGQMDEVRVWKIARTQEEIRRTMLTPPSNREPGLVAYWRFENSDGEVRDETGNEVHGRLVGNARIIAEELPSQVEDIPALHLPDSPLQKTIVLSGVVQNEDGTPGNSAALILRRTRSGMTASSTDVDGFYLMWYTLDHFAAEEFDLYATLGDNGALVEGMHLRGGDRRTINLTLKPAVSISGKLTMLDGTTPHIAVPVEAIHQDSKLVTKTVSDTGGDFQFINLKPGTYRLRCHVVGDYVYYGTTASVAEETGGDVIFLQRGSPLTHIDFRFASFKKGAWRNYTTFNGLAHNHVNAIYRTPDGILWFGTPGGVSRYDGTQFVNLTVTDGLVDDRVTTIAQDGDGLMWFGTWDGVSRYDRGTGNFTNLTTQDGLPHNTISAIYCAPDGIVWLGTRGGGGLSRYDGHHFENFNVADGLESPHITAISRDAEGKMWFGGGVRSVVQYDGGRFSTLYRDGGLPTTFVTKIHFDPNGDLWYSAAGWLRSVGLSRYSGHEFMNLTTEDGLVSNAVSDFDRDIHGVMWIATGDEQGEGKGVSRYAPPSSPLTKGGDRGGIVNFTTADGLVHPNVNAVLREPNGALWFGTDEGVSRYVEHEFANFTTRDGLVHDEVWAIAPDSEGRIWFGTSVGVSRYDPPLSPLRQGGSKGEVVSFTTTDGLPNSSVRALCSDLQKRLWFGMWGHGLSRYDGNRFINVLPAAFKSNSNFVHAIDVTTDGTLWMGTAEGLFRYDGADFVYLTEKDGLVDKEVLAVHAARDGTLWLGTRRGLSRYNGSAFVNVSQADELSKHSIFCIDETPDGKTWLGTDAGVYQYDGERFVNLTVGASRLGDTVLAIAHTADGTMWFGTLSRGVYRYDGVVWTSLDTRDGLAGNRVNAIYQDGEGFLWFGTNNGVTRFRPMDSTPPRLRITSVQTDRAYTKFRQLPPVALNPDPIGVTTGARVTIRYAAIDFKTSPEKRHYRFRIQEFDKAWRSPTNETYFEHVFAKPGSYTFEVQAIDRDLNYSEVARLTLQVVSPWYLAGWFVISSGASILAFLISSVVWAGRYISKRREAQHLQAEKLQLQEQMLEQERRARQELELRNRHTQRSALILSGWAHQVKKPLDIIRRELGGETMFSGSPPERTLTNGEIQERVEMVRDQVNRLLNAMVDLHLQPFDLKAELELLLYRSVRSYPNISFQTDAENIPTIQADFMKLQMAFENLFHNACQATEHNGGLITLRMSAAEGVVHIEVQDNGPGIEPDVLRMLLNQTYTTRREQGGSGLGLLIAQHIIEAHGGKIRLESQVGHGTIVHVELPIFLPSQSG